MNNFCCPRCGNKNLQITTEVNTQTTGSNYSASNGCLGYLIFGPLGLLCGSCGKGQKTTTTNTDYWVCPNCGNKFKSPENMLKDSKKMKSGAKTLIILAVIFAIVIFAVSVGELGGTAIWIALLPFAIFGLVALISNAQAKSFENQAQDLIAKMNAFSVSSVSSQNQVVYHVQNKTTLGTNEWKCSKCGRVNQNHVGTCGCGEEKPR